jgi:thioredoxin 1
MIRGTCKQAELRALLKRSQPLYTRINENPGTAAKFGIMSIPTLMLFKNGELASRQIGAAPKQKLEQWITGAV